jgi:hypothetical protein
MRTLILVSATFATACFSSSRPDTVYVRQPVAPAPRVHVIESRPPPAPYPVHPEYREQKIENKIEEKALKADNKAEEKAVKAENKIEEKAVKAENKAEEKALKRQNKAEEKALKRQIKGK